MWDTELVRFDCRSCLHRSVIHAAFRHGTVECPNCTRRQTPHNAVVFSVSEWDHSTHPHELVTCLNLLGIVPSDRRWRLALCAVLAWDPLTAETPQLDQALRCGEAWAETDDPPLDVRILGYKLGVGSGLVRGRKAILCDVAYQCVQRNPRFGVRGIVNSALTTPLSDAYRELFSNPFIPLEWNPEWFTPTVQQLASHIYESREFSAMPILGDALMDAGCDHQLIQEHCRSSKPHARGCWVVDAILGKT